MATLFNITLYQQFFVFLQIIITSFCLLFSSDAFSDTLDVEYKIKAAYLYNFTKFIYWPPKKNSTFNLCLVGKDYFKENINPIRKKTVQKKKIELFHYSKLPPLFQHCHIIYFTLQQPLKEIKNKNFEGILTIGEQNGFIEKGGMIQLFKKENRIKFKINKQRIENSGLEISAKLLELADIIEDNHE